MMSPAELWAVFTHLERHLLALSLEYGAWVYAIVFLVIWAETGLVIATALPSDTVLFAIGALVAQGAHYNLWLTFALMALAAFLGDIVTFACGRYLEGHFLAGRQIPFLPADSLKKAHEFYERHGGVTIIAGRFVPLLRALAPLIGGIAGMGWREFLKYNAIGKALWAALYLFGGYFFGRIPWVSQNFGIAIFFALGAPMLGVVARMVYLSVAKGR